MTLQPTLALVDLQDAIREGLMAFSCAAGMVVIAEMMEAERTGIVGPRGKHDPPHSRAQRQRSWLGGLGRAEGAGEPAPGGEC
jgi:hypothetical protein